MSRRPLRERLRPPPPPQLMLSKMRYKTKGTQTKNTSKVFFQGSNYHDEVYTEIISDQTKPNPSNIWSESRALETLCVLESALKSLLWSDYSAVDSHFWSN